MWNVITADKYSFYHLKGILLPLLFEVCTGAGLVDALKVQSSNSNTKVRRVQIHSLSEGLTRDLGCSFDFGQCTFVPLLTAL